MSVFSGRAPMCRAGPSAHGRTSTALNVGAFPHDSADPPPAGPGRMCNTASARPILHIRARSPRPDTADPHPPRTRTPAPSKVIRRASGRIFGRRYCEGCSGSGSERVPRVWCEVLSRELGRGAGRDGPPGSPPGAPGGVGRGGIGGPVVGGGPGGAGGRFRRPRSRSAPTARPAWWDGVSHVVTRPARLDHLRAVGPLAFRWTTVFREPGGPTAFKWSNGT